MLTEYPNEIANPLRCSTQSSLPVYVGYSFMYVAQIFFISSCEILYPGSYFAKLEEVSTQKEDRILIENKKDMKFDFKKGKILLMKYFQSDLERGEIYTLDTIKELNTLSEIEEEINEFKCFKHDLEITIGTISRSKTLIEIFNALIDTDLEDDDETVLSFFIEGLK